MSSYYNPRAYVPGGATPRVAQAIQALGRRRPVVRRPRPSILPPKPVVDPLLGRANTVAEQMFSPLFQRLGAARAAAEANARAAYGTHAAALEGALQKTSAPISGAFDTAIGQSAKVNEAVANRLQNQGQVASSGLATQLAQISADPAAAAQLAKFYQDAGNAEFAHGSADLQHLIARKGEAGSYQGKLPGIARLTANQDLQKALAEFSGEFAGQESDLRNRAAEEVSGLYGDFRAERQDAQAQAAAQKQALLELAQKERATLQALKAAAVTNAEKLQYAAQEKALDRKLKADIANLNAQTRLDTANIGAQTRVQTANISAQSKKTAAKKTGAAAKDDWKTPGSIKRQRVVSSIRNQIVNPETGRIREVFTDSDTPDKAISNAIWRFMRLNKISPTSPAGKKLWREVFLSLENTPSDKGPYALPQFVRGK